MEMLWQDIRYAFRMISKNPVFAAIVVVILAVGIGANTTIFSVVNAVMLRPLPYKDTHHLVTIRSQGIPFREGFNHRPNFIFLRKHNQVFESLAGYCGRKSYVTGIEKPHEVRSVDVTWNLFSLLGAQPLLGRSFLPEDERPESPRVVVLSHAFWKDYLGGSPDVIGKSINLTQSRLNPDATATQLNHENYTIIGIMPSGFDFPFARSIPFWTPINLVEDPEQSYPLPVILLARLKRGVTLEQANAELTVLASRLIRIGSNVQAGGGIVHVRRLLDTIVEGHRKLPLLLLGAAGFVLLIACGNVANLFLARATIRQREIAMCLALGASRGRIVCQMLTESLLLSLGAGILGLILTCWVVKGLVRLCPSDIPRLHETSVDLTVLGFTLGASILTGLLYGVMPAWRTSDVRVSETLKEGAGRTTSGRGWRRLHSGLVVSQLGLSLILLIGAALLIRSLIALWRMDLGFRPENILAINIQLPEAKYSEDHRCTAFFDTLLERLQTLTQVRSAAVIHHVDSLTDEGIDINFSIPGRTGHDEEHSARNMFVSPGFFETMGIKLLSGRTFIGQGQEGIIIDQTLAKKYFPDIDPVGQHLEFSDKSQTPVIGVVDTMRDFQTPNPTEGIVYSHGKFSLGSGVFLVRTDEDPIHLASTIRMHVAELEKDQVIKSLEPLEATLSQMLAPRRFVMLLLGLFAGIALILATVGVYGLLQYSTTQQIHDIGIRMALGARSVDILRTVLGQGLKLILIGIVIGLAGAVVLSRLLSSLLYDVTPTDAITLACVSLVLAVIALSASYIPARRAAKINPIEALRYE